MIKNCSNPIGFRAIKEFVFDPTALTHSAVGLRSQFADGSSRRAEIKSHTDDFFNAVAASVMTVNCSNKRSAGVSNPTALTHGAVGLRSRNPGSPSFVDYPSALCWLFRLEKLLIERYRKLQKP